MRQTRVWLLLVGALGVGALLTLACSTDSPTAPVQQPPPPGGPAPTAVYDVTIVVEPPQLVVGAEQPATVSVEIRRRDNNQPPPNGTTFVLATSLGTFLEEGGPASIAGSLVNGLFSTVIFAGSIEGTALLTAELDDSIGQGTLAIVGDLIADFDFENSNQNLSVQFVDTSEGGPTAWSWDFGDGGTSSEQHPLHVFPNEGDFLVILTVSRDGLTSTHNEVVTIDDLGEVVADFTFAVSECTAIFEDASTGEPIFFNWQFGDGGSSTEQNPVYEYASPGTYVVELEASSNFSSDSVSKFVSIPGGAGGVCL